MEKLIENQCITVYIYSIEAHENKIIFYFVFITAPYTHKYPDISKIFNLS